jgi:tetratricopeptide (TPR) repeat protein
LIKEEVMVRNTKRGIIFLLLFLIPLMIYPQTQEALRILKENNVGVVSLVVFGENKEELLKGAGFAVKQNELIITSYDLVSEAYEVKGKNYKGKNVKVEGIVAFDKDLNIALLKIKSKVAALPLGDSDKLEMGKRVFALGSTDPKEISISEGTILNFIEVEPQKRLVKPSLSLQEGFSGGPLLDLEGQVLGMNVELVKGLQIVIPINKIKPLIKSGRVTNFKNWKHEDYLSSLEGAFLAGRVLSLLDEPSKARIYLEDVVKADPDNVEAHAHLASAYTKLRYYDSAASSFQKVIQLDEDRASAHFGLGQLYIRMRKPKEAVAPLKRALELDPSNIEGFFQLGNVYEGEREFGKAVEMYKSYLSLKPETMWAGYLRLGVCSFEQGQYDEAISAFKEALKEKPEDVKINYNLAESYQRTGQIDEAAKVYAALAQIDPEGEKNYYGKMVRMYDSAGMFDKAIEAAQKLVDIDPNSEMNLYNLGIMFQKSKRYNESIEIFNKVLAIKPDYDLAYANIGLNYFNLKKYKNAVEAFEKYVEINPDNPDIWHNIGIGYMQLKKFNSALKPLQKSVELRPDYGTALYNLGITYLNLKDNYSARQVYIQLMNVDSSLAQKLKKYLR